VALAQDRFSTDVGDYEPDTQRKSRPGRARKAVVDEGQLARMVRELRDVEDDIVAKLVEADRLLVQLESRRIHEDGGYTSEAEFEQRMLASTPNLLALRQAVPSAVTRLIEARREPADARARQAKALTAIARTLDRLRGLDGEIAQCAAAAASQLRTPEGMRIYDECGYASFEEFLERALGPSPVLASVLALVPSEPVAERAAASVGDAPETGTEADESPPALFGESPALSDDAASLFGESPPGLFESPPGAAAGGAPPDQGAAAGPEASGQPPSTKQSASPAGRAPGKTIAISVVLSALAAIGGAAAGMWSQPSGEATSAAESAGAAATPTAAPASAEVAPKTPPKALDHR
jgi:hypothetical protein